MMLDNMRYQVQNLPYNNRYGSLAIPFSERRALLFVGDLLMLVLIGWGAFGAQGLLSDLLGQTPAILADQVLWLAILIATWMSFAIVGDSYDMAHASERTYNVTNVIICVVGTSIVYTMLFLALGQALFITQGNSTFSLPHLTVMTFLMAAPIALIAWRFSYIGLFCSMPLRRRAILVGTNEGGRAFVDVIRQKMPHYTIVGFVGDSEAATGTLDNLPILGQYHELDRLAVETGANEIILAVPRDLTTDMLTPLMHCYEQGISIKPMALLYEDLTGRVPVQHSRRWWFPVPTWSQVTSPLLQESAKRLVDIVLALVGSIGFFLILPFVALAIYLDNPGPIFYRQERTGKGGKSFYLMKFRSMVTDAEKHGKAIWATQNDPRITRIGKFLRLTRIDELPQLLNVLQGDMSIVGPRPERPAFISQLQEEIPFYRMRLSVKPGLTGWAQINYRYGSSVEDAITKLEYDLYYIKHQSLLLDILIILRTIKVVLLFRGT